MRPRIDRPRRPFRPRCLILGMILAWIVAIYVPAFILAALGVVSGSGGTMAVMWALTDQVELTAKLAHAALITPLLLAARRLTLSPRARMIADAILGAAAMLLLLALLPEGWSRGVGIGLTGHRFDPDTLPAYLAGGLLAGLLYNLADRKCGELSRPD